MEILQDVDTEDAAFFLQYEVKFCRFAVSNRIENTGCPIKIYKSQSCLKYELIWHLNTDLLYWNFSLL